jgi:hypothetical protein
MAAGCDRFLVKPCVPDDLLGEVRGLLRRNQERNVATDGPACREIDRWLLTRDVFGVLTATSPKALLQRLSNRTSCRRPHLTFACAFRRSAHYRFMRSETALRATADIRRVRVPPCLMDCLSARRRFGSASSGNVRSISMISARNCFKADSAPTLASSRSLSGLRPIRAIGSPSACHSEPDRVR